MMSKIILKKKKLKQINESYYLLIDKGFINNQYIDPEKEYNLILLIYSNL